MRPSGKDLLKVLKSSLKENVIKLRQLQEISKILQKSDRNKTELEKIGNYFS
jgi:predicted glycosyltransferase